jgi:predicted nucleic acid-binding protein
MEETPQNDYASQVLSYLLQSQECVAIVPWLWYYEVMNSLSVIRRVKKVPRAKVTEFLNLIKNFPIVIDEEIADLTSYNLLDLSEEYNLSAYDAAYFDLAMRRGLPLATLDRALRKAAENAGVPLMLTN